MNKKEVIEKFYDTTEATYYRHKKQNRPVIKFIEKYFTDDDLEEFLTTGKVSRLESQKIDDDFKDLILDDHMLHNVKFKLMTLSAGTFKMLEILQDALKDIDPNDDEFTLENAKQRLIDRIYAVEKNSIFKTKSKKEGVAQWIKDYLSKAEVYAMVKYPQTIIKLTSNKEKE